jgi:sulfur relay (sulfurtransferase) DsrF/TusC family protein
VAALLPKGIKVYAVSEDAAVRGLSAADMVDGVEIISRAGLPRLFAGYDQIWHW